MRIRSFDSDEGILYLVATPIGNLEDITFRAINVLKSVDKIYAEDTRTSYVLLNHYDIKTPVFSYHEFNQDEKTRDIVNEIKAGAKLALISDAGMPVISDPGFKIVSLARSEGLRVSTIPGPSASLSALISSGISSAKFSFVGFLNAKETKREAELLEVKYYKDTLIFYEAPHRLKETLASILKVLGDRHIVILRELTKTYEEYISGSVSEVLEIDNIKGEIVIILEGFKDEEKEAVDVNSKIDELISLGYKPNEAIKDVSKMFNLDRKEVYKNYLTYKNKGEQDE